MLTIFCLIIIFVGTTIPANVNTAKIDDRENYVIPSSRVLQPSTAIDSAFNGFTLWTQVHECIGYNPIVDAIQIVNRNFLDGGILNVHQAPGDLSYWVHDDSVYKKDYGAARYPSSIASGDGSGNGPHICFRASFDDCAIYEYGGWFSSLWDMPVPIGPAYSIIIGKQLPNSNILFIGTTANDILWKTMTPDLSWVLAGGSLATNCYYWGFDINGGIAYVFYFDNALNIYYKTTTDGLTWSVQQTYNMVWPNPYPQNSIYWTQAAVTDAGNPILVFNNIDDSDYIRGSYPWYGKVYVSHSSGQPCVEVSSTFGAPDTACFYPTIATGGNKVVVLYCTPRNNESDSLTWWDFYVAWSTDNGQTWGTPTNCTQSLTNRPGLPQLSKRIDTLRNRAYYVYAVDMVRNIDPYWHLLWGTQTDPMYICFDYAPYVGIEEQGKLQNLKVKGLKLEVYPNVIRNNAQLKCTVPVRQRISLKLYDILGRAIAPIISGIVDAGVYSYTLSFSKLSAGIYFLIFEGEEENRKEKILVVR